MLDAVQVRHVSVPSISSHNAVHTDLLPYSALVKWLRDCEPLRFSDVMEVCVCVFVRVQVGSDFENTSNLEKDMLSFMKNGYIVVSMLYRFSLSHHTHTHHTHTTHTHHTHTHHTHTHTHTHTVLHPQLPSCV